MHFFLCVCVLSCAILASAAGDVSASGLEQQGIAYATRAQHVSSGPELQHTTHVGLTNNTSQLASRVHANTCVLGCLFCFARSLGVTADADMGWHRVLGAVAGCSISSCVLLQAAAACRASGRSFFTLNLVLVWQGMDARVRVPSAACSITRQDGYARAGS